MRGPTQILEMVEQTAGTFTMLLGSIAAIWLVVRGKGIMKIMLVSVAERTREIGIRKAVGAKRRDALLHLRIDAIVLSSVGRAFGALVSGSNE